ncbi:hypothetical protein L0128_00155 [candidate division KSB1 bacterium]|nr:hypothetical protein [candidate division KSB1 bacterium]
MFRRNKFWWIGGLIFLAGLVLCIHFSQPKAFSSPPDTKPSAREQSPATEDQTAAALIREQISYLDHQSAVHLSPADKERYIRAVMFGNYLIVLSIAFFIVFRTRVPRLKSSKFLKMRLKT